MTKLLSDRIKDLHLRPDSPYPSQMLDAKEMIRQWRLEQNLHAIVEDNPPQPDNDDDFDGDAA